MALFACHIDWRLGSVAITNGIVYELLARSDDYLNEGTKVQNVQRVTST